MTELARYTLGYDVEPTTAPPKDYQFHYPRWYVLKTWHQYRNHGVLPEAGGWNDQPARLVNDDWGYLNWCYTYAMEQVRGEEDGPRGDSGHVTGDGIRDMVTALSGKKTGMSWGELTNGA